jgi:hypothetical protein
MSLLLVLNPLTNGIGTAHRRGRERERVRLMEEDDEGNAFDARLRGCSCC